MSQKVVIVDYGMGNLNSVKRTLHKMRYASIISSDAKEITSADRIILPGVGHFSRAMQNLKELGLIDALNEAVLTKKTPILGICLGMQLMANHSEEGNVDGLGWLNAKVVRFNVSDKIQFKVPHMGWNSIQKTNNTALLKDVPDKNEFYFVHSFHWQTDNQEHVASYTDYIYRFVSAVEKENIFGVQFHPEKSHEFGEVVLRGFLGD
ncbi:MAG: imidazole glycerol phosphate synthase subunit HisH [Desulfobulbaceae bacterium]|nr:imidazole glycerol phosphate synthase subunit HisH [Desulfobulbaceae bacterium]